MVLETEEPGSSKLINLKLRSKPPADNATGVSTTKCISTDSAAEVADEDPSKFRKTFGRTPDGTSNYSFPFV